MNMTNMSGNNVNLIKVKEFKIFLKTYEGNFALTLFGKIIISFPIILQVIN